MRLTSSVYCRVRSTLDEIQFLKIEFLNLEQLLSIIRRRAHHAVVVDGQGVATSLDRFAI